VTADLPVKNCRTAGRRRFSSRGGAPNACAACTCCLKQLDQKQRANAAASARLPVSARSPPVPQRVASHRSLHDHVINLAQAGVKAHPGGAAKFACSKASHSSSPWQYRWISSIEATVGSKADGSKEGSMRERVLGRGNSRNSGRLRVFTPTRDGRFCEHKIYMDDETSGDMGEHGRRLST
jgi:hypothetical protein